MDLMNVQIRKVHSGDVEAVKSSRPDLLVPSRISIRPRPMVQLSKPYIVLMVSMSQFGKIVDDRNITFLIADFAAFEVKFHCKGARVSHSVYKDTLDAESSFYSSVEQIGDMCEVCKNARTRGFKGVSLYSYRR